MSEQHTNTIKDILSCRSWEGPHGLLWFYKLQMADDTIAEVAKKSENAFTIGQELTYTLEKAVSKNGNDYWKLKEVKDFPSYGGSKGGGKPQVFDARSSIISYAKDVTLKMIEAGYIVVDVDNDPFDEIIRGAGKLLAWYEGTQPTEPQVLEFSGDTMKAVPEPPKTAPAASRTEENPVAQSLGDMVTTKQLGMIRAIAREIQIDAEAECLELNHCKIDELSKRAASSFIEHLQTLR